MILFVVFGSARDTAADFFPPPIQRTHHVCYNNAHQDNQDLLLVVVALLFRN